jgi:photosystem II stability/assembly factor-like uncharacterized protein
VILAFSEALGGLGKSIDAGASWKLVDETFSGGTVLHIAFDRNNPDTVYALTHANALYMSGDAGDTWRRVL